MKKLFALPLLLLCTISETQGEACLIRSHSEQIDITLCQENLTIPDTLFRDGFCQPQLQGQTVTVEFVEHCPEGAFGICRQARSSGMPYQQDIHYYGVQKDALYLKPFCEQRSQGTWEAP